MGSMSLKRLVRDRASFLFNVEFETLSIDDQMRGIAGMISIIPEKSISAAKALTGIPLFPLIPET